LEWFDKVFSLPRSEVNFTPIAVRILVPQKSKN